MRLLGVDFGERRIGFAISDISRTVARPLYTINVAEQLVDQVRVVVQEVDQLMAADDGLIGIVVGFPRALGGESNDQTKRVMAFSEALRTRISLPVVMQDERLTSHEAESLLAVQEKDWRRRKTRLDAVAAAVILQNYLDEEGEEN